VFYIIIGIRNIIKNFRRSLLTMVPIVIGMMACLLTQGFFNWNMNVMKEAMIHNGVGHFQLYAAGFSEFGADDPYNFLIENSAPILRELRDLPEIELATVRMAFNGILSSVEKSALIIGEAGEPKNESKLNSFSSLVEGAILDPEKPNALIIGNGVAKKLSAKIGDTLTLIGNMKDGGINAVDLELTGITRSGRSELDNISASTGLRNIQNLLAIDNSVQKIIILLTKTEDMGKVLPKIAQIADKYQLEYKDWETQAQFYQSLKMMNDVVFKIIIFIVLAIVTFIISNTVNMNIHSRIREIGTIRAQGTRRIQVALIFIIESSLMGLFGGLLGLCCSYLFIGFTELIGGLPVKLSGAEQLRHIFFRPDLATILICMLLFWLVAVIASIIPAHRGSKISITEALRWI